MRQKLVLHWFLSLASSGSLFGHGSRIGETRSCDNDVPSLPPFWERKPFLKLRSSSRARDAVRRPTHLPNTALLLEPVRTRIVSGLIGGSNDRAGEM